MAEVKTASKKKKQGKTWTSTCSPCRFVKCNLNPLLTQLYFSAVLDD